MQLFLIRRLGIEPWRGRCNGHITTHLKMASSLAKTVRRQDLKKIFACCIEKNLFFPAESSLTKAGDPFYKIRFSPSGVAEECVKMRLSWRTR
jgi:hypothetical protein